MDMETETLSSYEQNRENRLENNMDVDVSGNDKKSVSPINKSFEENTESTDGTENSNKKGALEENAAPGDDQMDSDEDCEEEEEQLLLSPAHSDKAFESDDNLSLGLNMNELDSDNEEKNEETERNSDDKEKNAPEINQSDSGENITEKVVENSAAEVDGEEKITENQKEDLEKCEEKINNNKDNEKTNEKKQTKETVEDKSHMDTNENGETIIGVEKESVDNKVKSVDDEKKSVVNDKKRAGDKKEQENDIEKEPTVAKEESKDAEVSDKNKNEKKTERPTEESAKKEEKKSSEENETEKNLEDTDTKENCKSEDITIVEEKDNADCNSEKVESKNSNAGNTSKRKSSSKSKGSCKSKGKSKPTKKQTKGKQKGSSSLLQETLTKPHEQENDINMQEGEEEMDMDEDFDPSLLCPELHMEVDEAPVITTSEVPPPDSDGGKSPMRLYDPIFSTFVDEITGAEVDFNLTAEELELKAKTYGPDNPIQYTKIHCTACNVHLGSALDGQGNRFVHPLLKVLICKKCYHFYTSGEFEKDEDGSELYCRWCGQGGQVLCCATCEMVFCKRCIRINFDRKKLAEIQKRDDWTCFRCNPSQLIHLRIHCAEFMEYIQTEMRRAGSSSNADSVMNIDYCQCCLPVKKKAPEPTTPLEQPKAKKRKRTEDDPDYNPAAEAEQIISTENSQVKTVVTEIAAVTAAVTPKPTTINTRMPLAKAVTPTALRPSRPGLTPTGVRPQAQPQQQNQNQNYVKIMPGGLRLVNPTAITRPPALRPIRPQSQTKHEWFEKTVRAAARVNSNLSYTLTQLNRAQANAASVEALAVVHNKLQEILSSSINSLIQIRKNLRTEFIAGIKNLRFPPKPTSAAQPSTSKDDDDVIFIPSDPAPPPLVPVTKAPTTSINNISLPSSLTLIKKPSTPKPSISSAASSSTPGPSTPGPSTPGPSTSTPSTSTDSNRPRGFLRVKSFSALQSVPAECITIPDDPQDEEVQIVKEKDPLDDAEVTAVEPFPAVNGLVNGNADENENKNDKSDVEILADDQIPVTVNTLTDKSVIKKLKTPNVILDRSSEIDQLVKDKFLLTNGDNADDEETVTLES